MMGIEAIDEVIIEVCLAQMVIEFDDAHRDRDVHQQ
jgi:hypothetical protein